MFNRYENKYILDGKTAILLQYKLSDIMLPDIYNQDNFAYPVCNIYYDTFDSYFIRTSLQKPDYKEKLRLRSYGTPIKESAVYIEIKKKFNKNVNKRRLVIELAKAYEFLETGKPPNLEIYMNNQVSKEVEYILSRDRLKPMVYLSYQRVAFFDRHDSDLRISFDTEITTRRYDLRLEYGIYGERLLRGGEWIMEIKTSKAVPVWLAQLLSEHEIYPNSFSKYGTEYCSHIVAAKGEINV